MMGVNSLNANSCSAHPTSTLTKILNHANFSRNRCNVGAYCLGSYSQAGGEKFILDAGIWVDWF